VNVLDVATATLRLKKDVNIKGQLAYAELTGGGPALRIAPRRRNERRSEHH